MVVRGKVYFPRGDGRQLNPRTCDLWGRLLQGEQQSTAVVGWGGLADSGGWHGEASDRRCR